MILTFLTVTQLVLHIMYTNDVYVLNSSHPFLHHHVIWSKSANFGVLMSSPKNWRQCLLTVLKINSENSFDSVKSV